ncbi:kinase-like domain-containing protein [Mycena rosella]|uniref:Kinase-like domain-containing protein n=1 Tax=Mycena rosella TaxID=1033263 RepID=A0AAD7H2G6_MYCRO|nr:kinase-like domain-containing protein [Mycena rosella]
MYPPASHFLPDLTGKFIDNGELELLCLLVHAAIQARLPSANIQKNELHLHLMFSDHPRVITLYRYFATEDFVFVVLELSTGGDFFDALVARELYRANPALIKQAFGELLDAVDVCHRHSVFHRDLKPENILCNASGTDIRLTDFGLSTQDGLSAQLECGTRAYMSPESIDPLYADGCYSPRHSDLWALSVIFTTMISGRHPWSSADMCDDGFAMFQSDNEYLRTALKITHPASELLKRCFHQNPRRRPTLPQSTRPWTRSSSSHWRTHCLCPPSSTSHVGVCPPTSSPRGHRSSGLLPLPANSTRLALPPAFNPPSLSNPLRSSSGPVPLLVRSIPLRRSRRPTPSPILPIEGAAGALGECDMPRPAFATQFPEQTKLFLCPFALDSCSSSESSSESLPPSSASSSAPPLVSNVDTASDSSAPATPPVFGLGLATEPGVNAHPAPPLRAYHAKSRAIMPSNLNEYRTVAEKGRPTRPTRREFALHRQCDQRCQ